MNKMKRKGGTSLSVIGFRHRSSPEDKIASLCETKQKIEPKSNDNYQSSFTKKFSSFNKIANRHVKITVSAAPIRYLCKWVCSEKFLRNHSKF